MRFSQLMEYYPFNVLNMEFGNIPNFLDRNHENIKFLVTMVMIQKKILIVNRSN